ncbi:MAG: SDR family NAD(P)-dependent oxidoreductase [Actinomycetota bacterium]|nr:SDR family NAD(P)-dependent oxidoreductase [Actinomycetota bacterium]
MELHNTIGILTGASRGIGVHLADALAARGVHLALAARSATDLEETLARVQSKGVRAIAVPTDVTQREDLERLVERTEAELGPPDLLVNNAGVQKVRRFESFDLDDIAWIINTNVVAVESLTRLVLPGMVARGRGHICNISSLSGRTAYPYNTVYASSKHAVVGFSWSLREEMRPYGVEVSVVCPGFVAEEGMFARRHPDDAPPMVARTVKPADVAAKTIQAIEENRAEVVVTKGLGNIVDVFHALSPDVTAKIQRKTGLFRFVEREADRDASA